MKVPSYKQRRFGAIKPGGKGVSLSSFHPAVAGARTLFPSRVFAPDELDRLLKSGHNARKIGAFVTKGRMAGWPIFTLTLEERASCPTTCTEWKTCYGNGMQAAERIEHGPDLIAFLEVEVAELAAEFPAGFLIRLHMLGDFWSVEYVRFWERMLQRHPGLALFGFTARLPGTPIGDEVLRIAMADWSRFAIRFSGSDMPERAAEVVPMGEAATAFICPGQTEDDTCCATCGLCWNSTRNIAFRRH